MPKPILCLDFDGVLHSYKSGWKGATVIPDPPVRGAMQFLWDAVDTFKVCIYSTRSHQPGGRDAMKAWVERNFLPACGPDSAECQRKLALIEYSDCKPSAMVTLDDRAITFNGTFPDPRSLLDFKPWNKK